MFNEAKFREVPPPSSRVLLLWQRRELKFPYLSENDFTIMRFGKRENIFACLFSVRNIINLSRHEQVCLIRLRFERYFSHYPVVEEMYLPRNF